MASLSPEEGFSVLLSRGKVRGSCGNIGGVSKALNENPGAQPCGTFTVACGRITQLTPAIISLSVTWGNEPDPSYLSSAVKIKLKNIYGNGLDVPHGIT